jgi:outer membrane lipopolysaccharide assembly protein LptE/RlpB
VNVFRPRALVLAGAVAFLAGSCAYTTSTALLPSHLKTVAVPVFENTTSEYTLQQEITDAVLARFVQDNHLKVVDERSADCVLRGKVTGYKNAVFGFSAQNRAQEYRVTITVSIVFKDQVKNREMWSDEAMVKTANYYVQDVPGQTAKTELDGRKEAIQRIADEILSRSTQGW